MFANFTAQRSPRVAANATDGVPAPQRSRRPAILEDRRDVARPVTTVPWPKATPTPTPKPQVATSLPLAGAMARDKQRREREVREQLQNGVWTQNAHLPGLDENVRLKYRLEFDPSDNTSVYEVLSAESRYGTESARTTWTRQGFYSIDVDARTIYFAFARGAAPRRHQTGLENNHRVDHPLYKAMVAFDAAYDAAFGKSPTGFFLAHPPALAYEYGGGLKLGMASTTPRADLATRAQLQAAQEQVLTQQGQIATAEATLNDLRASLARRDLRIADLEGRVNRPATPHPTPTSPISEKLALEPEDDFVLV